MDRKSETISISVEQINFLIQDHGIKNLQIREEKGKDPIQTQLVDVNSDGATDEIIFQTDIQANEEKKFIIEKKDNKNISHTDGKIKAYSRFVPENNEDYAWENDRVAFRVYGRVKEAQESGGKVMGGTSGVDAWLKRVDYPIIDKWYKKNLDAKRKKAEGTVHIDTYHTDTGEGYDPYAVGGSRGIGGIGIWENDSLFVSKPFTGYKTIASGPIRTIFEITYPPWDIRNGIVHEKKRISLDLGSNLSRFEVILKSNNQPLPNYAIGIALHEKNGKVRAEPKEGWFRYWEPVDDSELGVGVVLDPSGVQEFKAGLNIPKQINMLILVEPEHNTYYAGFGWKKSGQFNSPQEWDHYLQNFSRRLASPLEVIF